MNIFVCQYNASLLDTTKHSHKHSMLTTNYSDDTKNAIIITGGNVDKWVDLDLSCTTKEDWLKTIAYEPYVIQESIIVRQNNKLVCLRETARCFVSSNISLSHSRSLKVIQNDTVQ